MTNVCECLLCTFNAGMNLGIIIGIVATLIIIRFVRPRRSLSGSEGKE